MRDDRMGTILFGFFVVALLMALVTGIDFASGTRVAAGSATVVAKSYVPAQTSSGFGMASGSKGVTPVYVSEATPETYTVIARFDGEVRSFEVSGDVWAAAKEGESLPVTRCIGGVFGTNYPVRLGR